MGGYENGDSPAAVAGEDGVVLGVDGGTTNTVCVCLPAAMLPLESPAAVPVLARAVAGCSNRNSVGGNRRPRISPSRGWLVVPYGKKWILGDWRRVFVSNFRGFRAREVLRYRGLIGYA